MPTGPGIFFRRTGKHFSMELMLSCGKKTSVEATEWLEYLSARAPPGAVLEHAYNFGEREVAGHRVDGYIECFPEDSHPPLKPYTIAFEYMGTNFSLADTMSKTK